MALSSTIHGVHMADLQTGMVLAGAVTSRSGVLLVNPGQEITDGLLTRLRNFAALEDGVAEPLMVQPDASRSPPACLLTPPPADRVGRRGCPADSRRPVARPGAARRPGRARPPRSGGPAPRRRTRPRPVAGSPGRSCAAAASTTGAGRPQKFSRSAPTRHVGQADRGDLGVRQREAGLRATTVTAPANAARLDGRQRQLPDLVQQAGGERVALPVRARRRAGGRRARSRSSAW